jgi:hypothetical protein
MRDHLITFDDVIERLQATEPFTDVLIDSTSNASFKLELSWAEVAKNSGMTDLVPAYITVNDKEYQFTKEGILQATSQIGLKSSYVLKTPPHYIEAQLNYWFNSGLGDSVHKLVVVKDSASAFIRPTIVPFSNIELANSIYDGIQQHFGTDTTVLADFKFHNSLNRTDIRFIVPTTLKVIRDSNMVDVPEGSQDVWSTGISLGNSLTGKVQTSIDAYLFRWWCTNGATRTLDEVGVWNRRSNGQSEDSVYEWAANAVDDVLGGMEGAFDKLQSLTKIRPKSNTADVLSTIFSTHNVPVGNRESITNSVISANEITMYSVMNAITEQANNPTLSPERVDKLMKIGGTIPEHYFDDTKAKIFRQGQNAGPEAPNPYLVEV